MYVKAVPINCNSNMVIIYRLHVKITHPFTQITAGIRWRSISDKPIKVICRGNCNTLVIKFSALQNQLGRYDICHQVKISMTTFYTSCCIIPSLFNFKVDTLKANLTAYNRFKQLNYEPNYPVINILQKHTCCLILCGT